MCLQDYTTKKYCSRKVTEFVQNWKELGIECVVVIDGSVDMTKLQTWIGRRARDLGKKSFRAIESQVHEYGTTHS